MKVLTEDTLVYVGETMPNAQLVHGKEYQVAIGLDRVYNGNEKACVEVTNECGCPLQDFDMEDWATT